MATPVAIALAVCQCTNAEIQTLEVQERLNELLDWSELSSSDLQSLASKLERRTGNNRRIIPTKTLRNMEALCYWARDCRRRNIALDPANFTPAVMIQCREKMLNEKEDKVDVPDIKPERFSANKWKTWSLAMETYLSHVKGHAKTPIDYVIRIEPRPASTIGNQRMDEVYAQHLHGISFREDNRLVYRLIHSLTLGTEAEPWIRPFYDTQNGRSAWNELTTQYNGGAEMEKTMVDAEARIARAYYQDEKYMTFSAFHSLLANAYEDLRKGGRPKTEYDKVTDVLEKLRVKNEMMPTIRHHVEQTHRHDFHGAMTYLGTEFAKMFASSRVDKDRKAASREINALKQQIAELRRGGGNDRHNGGGRGGGGGGRRGSFEDNLYHSKGRTYWKGRGRDVDVTNVNISFSDEEMEALGKKGQAYIFQQRDKERQNRKRGNPPGGDKTPAKRIDAIGREGDDDATKITEDDISAITDPTKNTPAGKSTKGGRNGDAFGDE